MIHVSSIFESAQPTATAASRRRRTIFIMIALYAQLNLVEWVVDPFKDPPVHLQFHNGKVGVEKP